MKFRTVVVGKGIQVPKYGIPVRDLYLIAAKIQDEIIKRTQAGTDYKNAKFRAYSPRYLKYKKGMMAEKGGFVQSPSKVTLTDTGRMITSIQIKKQGNYAVIYFSNPERARIGYYHQSGAGRQPKREWLTISMKQRQWAMHKLQVIINNWLQSKGGQSA